MEAHELSMCICGHQRHTHPPMAKGAAQPGPCMACPCQAFSARSDADVSETREQRARRVANRDWLAQRMAAIQERNATQSRVVSGAEAGQPPETDWEP
jgi:hypothetical protein